jgi:hypothetical protein
MWHLVVYTDRTGKATPNKVRPGTEQASHIHEAMGYIFYSVADPGCL